MKDKLLIIAYAFPPIPYAGTYRTLRACKGLVELGVQMHVVTINQYEDIPNDLDLLSQVPSTVSVHRTPIIDPWRKYAAWKERHRGAKWFKYINKVVSYLLWFITIPDHMVLWVPFAFRKGLSVIKENDIHTVYVSSPPHSSQIVGLLLKKAKKVKWIVDLRDPIEGNIAEVHLINPTRLRFRIEKLIKACYERIIITNADRIITNTETHRKEMLHKYKMNKFTTIRNSFDQNDYKEFNGAKYDLFTIAHLGSIYGLRKVDGLLRAISALDTSALGPLNLQVLLVGLNDPGLKESVRQHGVQKYLKVLDLVPHKEAIEIMMKSHLLLLIKATGEGSYGQIPGKFYEYLGTRNRILFLGPEKSEVAEMISGFDLGYVIENDDTKMIDVLTVEYTNFLQGQTPLLDDRTIHEFDSHTMVQRMINLITE